MNKFLFFVPEQASSVAPQVDLFFFFMVAVSGFFSLLIAGLIVFFALRYHETRVAARAGADGVEDPMAHGHGRGAMVLELVWTAIPFALTMVMFTWRASLYFTLSRPPADALELYAV